MTNPKNASEESAKPAPTRAAPAAKSRGDAQAASTALLEIPEGEITPGVRGAVERLLAQLRDVRLQLDAARRRLERLEHMVDQDPLVPVANRRAFLRELARAIALFRRHPKTFGLLYCDVNGLKEINDTHGHGAGDAVLRHIVAAIAANIRGSDILARLGGDEFAILLPHLDARILTEKAAQLRREIEAAPCPWGKLKIPVSVTVGATLYGGVGSAEETLAAADRAMYAERPARRES